MKTVDLDRRVFHLFNNKFTAICGIMYVVSCLSTRFVGIDMLGIFLAFFALVLFYSISIEMIQSKRRSRFYKYYQSLFNKNPSGFEAVMQYYCLGYMKKDTNVFVTYELAWINKSQKAPVIGTKVWPGNANLMLRDMKKIGIKPNKIFTYQNSAIVKVSEEEANLIKLTFPQFNPNNHIHFYPLMHYSTESLKDFCKKEEEIKW